jgi:hypothetical protein
MESSSPESALGRAHPERFPAGMPTSPPTTAVWINPTTLAPINAEDSLKHERRGFHALTQASNEQRSGQRRPKLPEADRRDWELVGVAFAGRLAHSARVLIADRPEPLTDLAAGFLEPELNPAARKRWRASSRSSRTPSAT